MIVHVLTNDGRDISFRPEDCRIMGVALEDADRENIAKMVPGATLYYAWDEDRVAAEEADRVTDRWKALDEGRS